MTEKSAHTFVRLPGLLRRWEIERVLEAGADFHIEDAGTSPDGSPLFAVYRRGPEGPHPGQERATSSPRRREVRR
ncbi:MAG: hypothetical protein EDX89_23540 [Acidobacteria bacterium]|nr:MAG: hypothetical protein EDX89_23540 [Acidobacteriota bacterium]